MSRRFGRNQKRRMRAELAERQERITALEEVMRMDRGLLEWQGRKMQELRDQLSDIASEVVHQSALVGVEHHLPHGFDGMRLVPLMPPGEYSRAELWDKATVSTEKITYETLRLLDVKAVRDRFNGQLHCYVDLAGKTSAYGITESTIRGMSLEALTRRIVPELARHLLEQLKNVYR